MPVLTLMPLLTLIALMTLIPLMQWMPFKLCNLDGLNCSACPASYPTPSLLQAYLPGGNPGLPYRLCTLNFNPDSL